MSVVTIPEPDKQNTSGGTRLSGKGAAIHQRRRQPFRYVLDCGKVSIAKSSTF